MTLCFERARPSQSVAIGRRLTNMHSEELSLLQFHIQEKKFNHKRGMKKMCLPCGGSEFWIYVFQIQRDKCHRDKSYFDSNALNSQWVTFSAVCSVSFTFRDLFRHKTNL